MTLDGYDFDDNLIRDMVNYSHRPTEKILTTEAGVEVQGVVCERCAEVWPCPPITAYRQWMAEHPA